MITTLIARLAMMASLAYYTLAMGIIWISALTGSTEEIWEAFDVVESAAAPPMVSILTGTLASMATLVSLAVAYWSVEKTLSGGREQDFLALAAHLRRIALGLMGFWLGWNLLTGVMPTVLTWHLPAEQVPEFDWDPLDLDIILLILAIALYAISRVLQRAWAVEEENRQFL